MNLKPKTPEYVQYFRDSNRGDVTICGCYNGPILELTAAVSCPTDDFSKKEGKRLAMLRQQQYGPILQLNYHPIHSGATSKGNFFSQAANALKTIVSLNSSFLPPLNREDVNQKKDKSQTPGN